MLYIHVPLPPFNQFLPISIDLINFWLTAHQLFITMQSKCALMVMMMTKLMTIMINFMNLIQTMTMLMVGMVVLDDCDIRTFGGDLVQIGRDRKAWSGQNSRQIETNCFCNKAKCQPWSSQSILMFQSSSSDINSSLIDPHLAKRVGVSQYMASYGTWIIDTVVSELYFWFIPREPQLKGNKKAYSLNLMILGASKINQVTEHGKWLLYCFQCRCSVLFTLFDLPLLCLTSFRQSIIFLDFSIFRCLHILSRQNCDRPS